MVVKDWVNILGNIFFFAIVILSVIAQILNRKVMQYLEKNEPEILSSIYPTDYLLLMGQILRFTRHLKKKEWMKYSSKEIDKKYKALKWALRLIYLIILVIAVSVVIYVVS